ncbi:MAG: AAA family ATPase [Kiritimatiellae bacterium]|jgi:predicted AAA+ superfamily ATPase|nr:AAA family ATPase [Kiritimatiellia bacterium]
MRRQITKKLVEWKDRQNRKPLIIRGARQVGKTYSITEFGHQFFKYQIKIDFEKNVQLRKVFQGDLSPKRLVQLIELETEIDIIEGETLLFMDEIQLCPQALASLRYFHEDMPNLHVIAAGSLLEFEMEKISFPVGRVEFMYMHPLTFEEFLINIGQERLNAKRPALFETNPVEELIHDRLLDKLREFFVVGGMPEAVNAYINRESLKDVHQIHDNLVSSLIQDMLKYEKLLENDLIREIFETIPLHIGSAIKYSKLSHNASLYKVKQVLQTLEKALLVTPVRSSSASGLPLGGNINKSTFKLCMVDIGLMQFLCGLSPKQIIQSDNLLAAYKGSLCEQFVGQELKAAGGSQNNKLFYWSRAKKSSNAEVDYLLARDGTICPLEIKHGPAGRLKSLHYYLEEHLETEKALVFNAGNIGLTGKIHFMPIYTKLSTV